MGTVQTIELNEGLERLQDLLGESVRALVNFRGTFGSCAIYGLLSGAVAEPADGRERWIEFLPPLRGRRLSRAGNRWTRRRRILYRHWAASLDRGDSAEQTPPAPAYWGRAISSRAQN